MSELTPAERAALRLVSVGVVHVRAIARLLPDSSEAREILALADAMHNIPAIVAGSVDERQANVERLSYDVAALGAALGIKAPGEQITTSKPMLTLVNTTKPTAV